MKRRLSTAVAVRLSLVAVAAAAVLLSVARTNADPSFGLLPGSPSLTGGNGPGDVLEPTSGDPIVVLDETALGLPTDTPIDALSFGNDNPRAGTSVVLFSVDETSIGYPRGIDDVYAEAAGIDSAAAADVFASSPRVAYPLSPSCGGAPNRLAIDGDGLLAGGPARATVPGLGLDEGPPGPPGTAERDGIAFLEASDNLFVDPNGDGAAEELVFFSVPSGVSVGFPGPSGADIYVRHPTQGLVRFADAATLGLSIDDDIDALAVYHVGTDPSFTPAQDVVVFSLARDSASLGTSALPVGCGLPADSSTAADLFVKIPLLPAALYLSAEQLGLCAQRSFGLCNPFSEEGDDNVDAIDIVHPGGLDDDVDGLDNVIDFDDDNDGLADWLDDSDSDGVYDNVDNCRTVSNADQTNSDSGPSSFGPGDVGSWSNGPTIAGEDVTLPSGDSLGDVCDPDDDNDSRADADEAAGGGCDGKVTVVSPDNRYGVDGVGTPDGTAIGPPPPGITWSTSWDTDGDTVPDGVECAAGTDPTTAAGTGNGAADRSACASLYGSADADEDGLRDYLERCKWQTNPNGSDTDGDGMGDCHEAYDVNGNGFVTTADASLVLRAASGIDAGDLAAEDANGNGFVAPADRTIILRAVNGLDPCF